MGLCSLCMRRAFYCGCFSLRAIEAVASSPVPQAHSLSHTLVYRGFFMLGALAYPPYAAPQHTGVHTCASLSLPGMGSAHRLLSARAIPCSPCFMFTSVLLCVPALSFSSADLRPNSHDSKSQKPQPWSWVQNPFQPGQAVVWVTSPGDGTKLCPPCAWS